LKLKLLYEECRYSSQAFVFRETYGQVDSSLLTSANARSGSSCLHCVGGSVMVKNCTFGSRRQPVINVARCP